LREDRKVRLSDQLPVDYFLNVMQW
jgi:hypothetical protein